MKSTVTTLAIIIFAFLGYSQDSTLVRKFFNQDSFPNIDTIYYQTNKIGKRIKSEGWVIEEFSRKNSIMYIETNKGENILQHKMGVWKHYSKKGGIKQLDSIKYTNNQMQGVQHFFDKEGRLESKVFIMVKNSIFHKNQVNSTTKLRKIADEEMIQIDYDTNGKKVHYRKWIGDILVEEKKFL